MAEGGGGNASFFTPHRQMCEISPLPFGKLRVGRNDSRESDVSYFPAFSFVILRVIPKNLTTLQLRSFIVPPQDDSKGGTVPGIM
jgi:hypothetical protein